MKNYISLVPSHSQEICGLIEAVYIQIEMPYNSDKLKNSCTMHDFINAIAGKFNLNITVNNTLNNYAPAINQIANYLVDNHIANETALEQHLKEYLLKYPLLRL